MRAWGVVAILVGLAGCGGRVGTDSGQIATPDTSPASSDASSDGGGPSLEGGGPPTVEDAAYDAPPPTEHDEDRDGVVDAVDNCPNVANPDQAGAVGPLGVGTACRAFQRSTRVWGPNARRVFFDPFTGPGPTSLASGSFPFGPDRDSLHGESGEWGSLFTHADPGPPLLKDDATVVTAIVRWRASNPEYAIFGVAAEFSSSHFLLCAAEVFARDGVLRPAVDLSGRGCDGSCDITGTSAPTPSFDTLPERVGVRMITSLAEPGATECQLFDPARPSTLTDPSFAASYGVGGTGVIATSSIGFHSRGAIIDLESIEVLRLSNTSD
jgi:hypothetical protein